MNIFEIISAIVLIIACVMIVVIVLMKDTKTQMSQSISGSTSDSFYQKNAGKTKEAMLNKATIVSVVVFFILALAVNVINVYWGGKDNVTSDSSATSSITASVDSGTSDTSSESSEISTNVESSTTSSAE